MSSSWTIQITSRTEAVELKHIVPHLRQWKGMKRVSDDNRRWELGGGEIALRYVGRLGGATLFNTIECTYSTQQTPEQAQRIFEFAEWASAELGWARIDPEF